MNFNFVIYFLTFSFGILFQVEPQEAPVPDSLEHIRKLSSDALGTYDYENSIRYSLQLVEMATEKDDDTYLYHAYNILGIIYEDRKNLDRAEVNYIKALGHAEESGNDTLLIWGYNNLAGVYAVDTKTMHKGLEYYNKAIEVGRRLKDPKNSLAPILNKGWTHLDYNQYDKALPFLFQAEKLLVGDEDPLSRAQLLTLFGRYYSGKENFERARCFFLEALAIEEKERMLLEASETYKAYANMWLASGDYEQAYAALEKHLEFQAELFEEEKIHQMEAAYARYQTEEYRNNLEKAEIEQLALDREIARTKETTAFMIAFLLVMLVFLILLFRNNATRKKLISELRDKNTQLLQAKEEAERLSLMKTRFFSTVSHELRTPLYGVVGLTSLLLEENEDKEKEEDLKSLKFSADYLLALINDVLQMNKMESNLVRLENIPFNVEELLQGIIKSFEFTRNQNRNSIELEIDPEIPKYLIGDSVRLSQVLMNLIGNAVKFTKEGKVWIKATYITEDLKTCDIGFEIGDTGVGIPADKQKEIFEEFSQLRSENYNYHGTGLGLSIVEKMLELFGSRIELESDIGKGSVFTFTIQFKKGEDPDKESIRKRGVECVNDGGNRALIVDDNRINQVVTQRILEKKDFVCEVAGDGYEAIEKVRTGNFDLVLMDVNMPGISGLEATKEIRKFNLSIPIIALTAVEIEEMREEILRSGMNDIVVKPYDTDQLYHTVYRNLMVTAVPL